MKSFKIKNTKNLSELGEDIMTIKKITSDKAEDLHHLSIMYWKDFPNGSGYETAPLPTMTWEGVLVNKTEKPTINLNYKITDCKKVKLVVSNPEDVEFEIYYETLQDKLENLKKKEEEARTNIEDEVNKWRQSVHALFNQIQQWTSPYAASVLTEQRTINITEEGIKPYATNTLIVKPKFGKNIAFRPIGTFIIGAHGRVDVDISGFGRSIMLILNRRDGVDNWFMVIDRNPSNRIPFDKAQFINLLDEVIPS